MLHLVANQQKPDLHLPFLSADVRTCVLNSRYNWALIPVILLVVSQTSSCQCLTPMEASLGGCCAPIGPKSDIDRLRKEPEEMT